jgi:tetratricopeptide (TPR) repeat protein
MNIPCFLVAILCIFALVGCSSDQQDDNMMNPESDLQGGWQEYNSGNYEAAMLAFEKALNEKPSSEISSDAYNGLGWSYIGKSQEAEVNQMNLANAIDKFRESINQDKTNSDAWIGQACVFLIRKNNNEDLQNILKSVDNALQGDGRYLYRHDYDSEADIHALKAQSYYYLNRFEDAQNEIGYALAIEKENNIALAIKDLIDF